MNSLSPIDLIKQATLADERFAAAIVFGSSAINYVDAEYTRRILDEDLRRRLEKSLG